MEVQIDGETRIVPKNHTVAIPPGTEHGFKVIGDQTAELLVLFPALDPYSAEHTHYLEGARPASVKD